MSSRIPLPYPRKVLELFKNPKNLGRMEDANASAVAGSLACGDMIAIYLKIDEGKNIVEKASFESYGCAANIAAASIMTEMIKGKRLRDAWNISWKDSVLPEPECMEFTEALGGLPSVKYHCGVLAVGALRRAIRAYFKDKNLPKWLPEELTHEEKHALEEEKLMELLYRKNDSGKV